MEHKQRILAACLMALATAALPARAAERKAAPFCGNLANPYGPYDYRKGTTEFAYNLHLVESAHFTEEVENGIKGNAGTLGGDIDYTLRAFPNHPGALNTVIRVAARNPKSLYLPGGTRPVECFFDRAVRFAPDDPAAYTLYGSYLLSVGRVADARPHYVKAVELDPDNPSTNYNMGLVYFKNKDMANANKYAQKAYALGFPLPGLKNMLIQAGKWDVSAAPPPEALKKPAVPGEQAEAAEPAAPQAPAAAPPAPPPAAGR
jgi:tetratricopeptide (TPR) repeat protein